MTVSEIPESRALLVLVLVADMLISIIRDSVAIADGDPLTQAQAVVSLHFLILLSVVIAYIVIAIVFLYKLVDDSKVDGPGLVFKVVSVVTQATAGLLYLYGDNISYLLEHFAVLGCQEVCVTNNRIAAFLCLGFALIIFHFVPDALDKCYNYVIQGSKDDDQQNPWCLVFSIVSIIVKADILYSAAFIIMVDTVNTCSRANVYTSSFFLAFCCIAGFILMIVYLMQALVAKKSKNFTSFLIATVAGTILFAICFPLYMLADNSLPLDCGFSCELLPANSSSGMIDFSMCDEAVNSGIRLGFSVTTFLLISGMSLLYGIFGCNANVDTAANYIV